MPDFGPLFGARSYRQRALFASICPLWYLRYAMMFDNVEEVDIDELAGIVGDGYVQRSRDEMEAPFTILAERHERGSEMLTTNSPCGEWEQIFQNALTVRAGVWTARGSQADSTGWSRVLRPPPGGTESHTVVRRE